MLKDEEDRLRIKQQTQSSHNDHASASQVLLASSSSSQRYEDRSTSSTNQDNRGNRNNRGNRGGHNNNKGRGNWQGNNWDSRSPPPWTYPNFSQWPNYPQWPNTTQWQNRSTWPNQPWMNSRNQTSLQHPTATTNANSGILGNAPSPNGAAYISTITPSAPPPPVQNSDFIPTQLANAFNTMTLSDPSDAGWYMDTGATAHLTAQFGTLHSISSSSSSSSLPLITVGNGSIIPAIASGNSTISSLSRPLYLNNVLLCPKILKNLISVRQFTTDNLCSVEFDLLGFLVKDLRTKAPIIRCDSTGPLYAVSPPSSSTVHHAHLTSVPASIWHQRFGHPGNAVF